MGGKVSQQLFPWPEEPGGKIDSLSCVHSRVTGRECGLGPEAAAGTAGVSRLPQDSGGS